MEPNQGVWKVPVRKETRQTTSLACLCCPSQTCEEKVPVSLLRAPHAPRSVSALFLVTVLVVGVAAAAPAVLAHVVNVKIMENHFLHVGRVHRRYGGPGSQDSFQFLF